MKPPVKQALLALLALLLILPACTKVEQKAAATSNPACNWPPDTMMITIQGAGRIVVHFHWRDPAKSASPCPGETFVLSSMPEATPASTSRVLLKETHTPPDTTPAGRLAEILSAPASGSGGNELPLIKWPPDTSSGGGK